MKEKIKKKLKMYIGFWLCVRDQRKVETTHTHTHTQQKKNYQFKSRLEIRRKKKCKIKVEKILFSTFSAF